jgi:2-polyprenyl-3-methyl-5-hydroxy-6-metoxy-1,4-benzoquinol methylase
MISSASPSVREGFRARRARLRRIASRFDAPSHLWGYIVGKLALDPAYSAVLEHVRDSGTPIIDVGCGLGLLAHYLREHDCHTPIVGYDLDAEKIARAEAAARRAGLANVVFRHGDAAEHGDGSATIVLLDVLHYLAREHQRDLLARLARNEGTVLIRNGLRDRSWRYHVTLIEEYWTRWSGWIPSRAPIHFPTREEILAPFHEAGRAWETRPLWGMTPFSSQLFVFAPTAPPHPAPAAATSQAPAPRLL